MGDGLSRAFLQALVQLIGGYRDALVMQEHKEITFNRQAFIESRPSTMQPFLKKMLELQIFQQVFLLFFIIGLCLKRLCHITYFIIILKK